MRRGWGTRPLCRVLGTGEMSEMGHSGEETEVVESHPLACLSYRLNSMYCRKDQHKERYLPSH